MHNRDGRTEPQDLDAVSPGQTRTDGARPDAVSRPIRLLDEPESVDITRFGDARFRAYMTEWEFQIASQYARRTFGMYWAAPRRMFLTPILAAASARFCQYAPALFPDEVIHSAGLLVWTAPGEESMGDLERMEVAKLARAGASIFRDRIGEGIALAELGLEPAMSLADRVAALKKWLAGTELPVAWVALQLPAAVAVGAGQLERLLLAERPFRDLGECFAALAERQGIKTWEDALLGAVDYWNEVRGSAFLHSLAHRAPLQSRAERIPAPPQTRAPDRNGNRSLLKKLVTRLGRAKREAEVARSEADARLARVSAAEREIADVRRGRDRAMERLKKVEAENTALRAQLAAASVPEPAPDQAMAPAAPEQVISSIAPVPLPPLESVFAGRLVYLYTGIERAAAREAMAGTLEHYGATCEVFDGNRTRPLGPERFPPDALVIIETSHLCHSNSERIEARARASGAWFYVGAAGSAALAGRVAERWWRTHQGRVA